MCNKSASYHTGSVFGYCRGKYYWWTHLHKYEDTDYCICVHLWTCIWLLFYYSSNLYTCTCMNNNAPNKIPTYNITFFGSVGLTATRHNVYNCVHLPVWHQFKGLILPGPILLSDTKTRGKCCRKTRGSKLPRVFWQTFSKGVCQVVIWDQEGLIPNITYHNFRHVLNFVWS